MKTPSIKQTSAATQRAFIHHYLLNNDSATTQDFRNVGVYSPAPRIKELRDQGINIKTAFVSVVDHAGVQHHGVARYFLKGGDK
jgi:hypothetical protein